jgi:hypothetical protein
MGLAGLTGHFAGLPASLASLGFPAGLGGVSSQQAAAAAALAAVAHHHQAAAAVRGGGAGGGLGCVLLVSNLNETETEPDHLFILFGVYGDVQVPVSVYLVIRSIIPQFSKFVCWVFSSNFFFKLTVCKINC